MLTIKKLDNKYDKINTAKILLDQNLVIIFINKKALNVLNLEKKKF